MPITIPAFAQFQAPLVPLRGLWNHRPKEGDRFLNAEIDWPALAAGATQSAFQFNIGGNSPVALSQIVALYVDNTRCGGDLDFIFPDSSFSLSVPAHDQGLFPVLTNALMFYAIGIGATLGDMTILQILNTMPPPIAGLPARQQTQGSALNVSLGGASTTQIIAASISGTLEAINISGSANGPASGGPGTGVLSVIDGSNAVLWTQAFSVANNQTQSINVNLNLQKRFIGGLRVTMATVAGGLTGSAGVNVYYTQP